MINKRLKKVLLGVTLLSSTLFAGSFDVSDDTRSLVGIEGGYSALGYEHGTNFTLQDSATLLQMGLKVGAESEHYRVFISGRYMKDNDSKFDYITTYGVELQYKFNVTKELNFFIGANGGIANMKFKGVDSVGAPELFSRTLQSPYIGGDLGTNINLFDSTSLELGGRVMSIQAENTKSGMTYRVNNIVSAYASIIFKWKMD